MNKNNRKKNKGKFHLGITTVVIGCGFIFFLGIGFILGLNYAQKIYLKPNRASLSADDNEKPVQDEEFSFYYNVNDYKKEPSERVSSYNDKQKNLIEDTEKDLNLTAQEDSQEDSTADSFYTIQVYSFKSKEIADQIVSELKEKGYTAFQSELNLPSGEDFYRVRVGHFSEKAEAVKTFEAICRNENKDAFITFDR